MRNLNYLNDKRIDLYGCIGDEYNGAFKLRIILISLKNYKRTCGFSIINPLFFALNFSLSKRSRNNPGDIKNIFCSTQGFV